MFRGEWARELARDVVLNMMAASPLVPRTLRFAVYRAWGVNTDTRAIQPRCFLGGGDLTIGAHTYVGHGCFFDTSAPISIGSRCALAMQVLLCTSTHSLGGHDRRADQLESAPIAIGDGCWIGARAVVLPGVRIGDGCMIGAGAVVTKDCAPNGMYVGNPARRVRELPT